jgi:hypothetical protein
MVNIIIILIKPPEMIYARSLNKKRRSFRAAFIISIGLSLNAFLAEDIQQMSNCYG